MAKIAKRQYYLQYLGWKEVQGVWGREFTESITKELIKRRSGTPLPKLTIEVSSRELKITQLIEKKDKIQKLKYPPIPAKDVTYAVQATSPDEDVVSCIYLGYNPQTRCAVHVHVYRCDSIETAELFADHLTEITEIPEYQQRALRIEQDLVTRDQIKPRPSAFVGSSNLPDDLSTRDIDEDDRLTSRSAERAYIPDTEPYVRPGIYDDDDGGDFGRGRYNDDHRNGLPARGKEDDVSNIYDSVAAELKAKLERKKVKDQAILYPPKDYDTIHRKAGNAYIQRDRTQVVDIDIDDKPRSDDGNRVRSWHEDARSHDSRGSRGSHGSDDFADVEVKAVRPHWKSPQNYVGLPRAVSPPPDLQGDSYFPSNKDSSALPNYLSPRSSPTMPRRLGSSSDNIRPETNIAPSKPRYGPASLGLAGRPSRDEGYTAMDRNPPRGRRQDEGPYGHYLTPDPIYSGRQHNGERSPGPRGGERSPGPRGERPRSPGFRAGDRKPDLANSHISRSMGDDFALY